jgi:hypothetical protein
LQAALTVVEQRVEDQQGQQQQQVADQVAQ